jgi:hypothetical protein
VLKLYRRLRVQALPASIQEAGELFSPPMNLPAITPPWLGLRITGEDVCGKGHRLPREALCGDSGQLGCRN